MYNLMVVDDEKYAVWGISRSITWEDIGITNVFEAFSANEAKEVLGKNNVHIIICDIEMPDNNGLQLAKWIREHYDHIKIIFLSGHADFTYVQTALKIESYDYLLKPVDHDILKNVVRNALKKVEEENAFNDYYETYEKAYKLWEKQLPLLIERLWQTIFARRRHINDSEINQLFSQYNLPLTTNWCFIPIVFNVYEWYKDLTREEEEIMECGMKNIAEETILVDLQGNIVKHYDENHIAVIYCEQYDSHILSTIKENCTRFIEECRKELHCSICCYVGMVSDFNNIVTNYHGLLNVERTNITLRDQVIMQQDNLVDNMPINKHPDCEDWTILFKTGKKEELFSRIYASLNLLNEEDISPEILEAYYFAIMNIIYQGIGERGFSVYDVYKKGELYNRKTEFRSVLQIKLWIEKMLSTVFQYLESQEETTEKSIIKTIKEYIVANFQTKISRQDIARHIYLNPSYLSRLFKSETGTTLSDYITEVRIDKAKELIKDTNNTISSIAEAVGYQHFSHFAKTFKKNVGMLPFEYRVYNREMDK